MPKKFSDTRSINTGEDATHPMANHMMSVFGRHLIELLSQSKEGVFMLDPNGYFVFVNKTMEEFSGIQAPEFAGLHFSDIVIPKDHETIKKHFEKVMSGQDVALCRLEYVTAKGYTSLAEVKIAPMYDGIMITGVLGISRDVSDKKQLVAMLKKRHGEILHTVKKRMGELTAANLKLKHEIRERKKTEAALIKREKEYQLLVHTANSAIIRIDTDCRITFMNEFAVRLFGFTNEEIIGHSAVGTIVPEVDSNGRDQALKMKDIVRHPERYWTTEHQNMSKDGRRLWMSWTHKALFDEHQRIHEVLCVGNDVTSRKMAEEAKRRTEIRLVTAIESLPFDFYIIDDHGLITMQNSTCRERWGAQTGKKFEDLDIAREDKKLWRKIRRKVLLGDVFEDEIEFQTKGPKGIYYNVTQPIVEGSRISGFLGINIDITALKETEKALKERERELETNYDRLAEINIALEVLLKKKAEDKIEFEDRVLHNIKELLYPYINKMKKTRLDDRQIALLSILESNISELISPFSRRLTLNFLKLAPTEVQIANLIKNGKTSQQIAVLMGSSRRTIDTHRKNIRKKMGIHGKKGNLRSHLLAYQ